MFYCGAEHQKAHWKKHKSSCTPLLLDKTVLLKLQAEALKSGKLQINYLNPRSDRTLETHGTDTLRVLRLTSKIRKFAIAATGLNSPSFVVCYASVDYQLQHGKCAANVNYVIQKEGGSMLFGYSIYEGKHMLELGAHCVWIPSTGTYDVLDVTKDFSGFPQSGLFLIDSKAYDKSKGGFQPNIIWWK